MAITGKISLTELAEDRLPGAKTEIFKLGSAPMALNSNTKGALFALTAFLIFSSHDAFVKIIGEHMSPFQIVFFSVLLSFPLATVMLMRDRSGGDLIPVHPWWTGLRSIAVVLTGFSAFYAFSTLPMTTVYAILFATPLLITILSIPVLGETVRLRRWMAVLVGLCGVFVVLRPGGDTELGLGHLAALVAAIGGATASVIVRKIGRDERSAVLMLYPMLSNFIVMGCALPFFYVPMQLEQLGILALVSIFAFIASLLIIAAYRSAEAVIVAPMQYSQILWATIFGMLFFDETPDLTTLIGAAIVIGSGCYIVLREGGRNVSQNTPVLETRSRTETGTIPRVSRLMRPADRNDDI